MGQGPDGVRDSERVTHAPAGETPLVELGGISEVLCPRGPGLPSPGGASVHGLCSLVGARSTKAVNGSSTSLQPFLPSSLKGASIEIIEISASFRVCCETMSLPGLGATFSPTLCQSCAPSCAGALFGGVRAPRVQCLSPPPRSCPPHQGSAQCTNGTRGGGAQEVTSLGPPHLLIPYKKQNGDSERRVGSVLPPAPTVNF